MFLDIDRQPASATAVIDDLGRHLGYGELRALCMGLAERAPGRPLVFSLCENSVGSLVGYLAFLSGGAVPLMLEANIHETLLRQLADAYRPAFFWQPEKRPAPPGGRLVVEMEGYALWATGLPPFPLHEDLALLITTSGSTGSPKLVRQSRRNLLANARSIVEYLKLDATERPVSTLPMNYVYGISIVNSHLLAGATLLLTRYGLLQREFWGFFGERRATSLSGVPYTYEMLSRLKFFDMDLPSLRAMTQAGGKLPAALHESFAAFAERRGLDFVIMYGAAEATARMGYLPPRLARERIGSIGVAIPGGRFELRDEDGKEVLEADRVGELVYHGDNVTLGYAECGDDLAKGDERGGRLATGDMARRDRDGFYYITGRKNRFLKIFGNRVGLDDTEHLLKEHYRESGCDFACAGADGAMSVYCAGGAAAPSSQEIKTFLSRVTGLHHSAFQVVPVGEIPKNSAGKTLYAALGGSTPDAPGK